jgi:hypothetical protein
VNNKTNAEPISTTGQIKKEVEDARGTSRDTYIECRECSECQHVGINDAGQHIAACNHCPWYGPSPAEDKCPACSRIGTMGAACPRCGALYNLIAEKSITAPQGAAPSQPNIAHRLTDAELADPEYVRAYVDECFEALEEMKGAAPIQTTGTLLANVAFNFAQKAGHTLTSDDCAMLDKLRKEWDRALQGNPSSSQKPLLAADDKPLNTNVRATDSGSEP